VKTKTDKEALWRFKYKKFTKWMKQFNGPLFYDAYEKGFKDGIKWRKLDENKDIS